MTATLSSLDTAGDAVVQAAAVPVWTGLASLGFHSRAAGIRDGIGADDDLDELDAETREWVERGLDQNRDWMEGGDSGLGPLIPNIQATGDDRGWIPQGLGYDPASGLLLLLHQGRGRPVVVVPHRRGIGPRGQPGQPRWGGERGWHDAGLRHAQPRGRRDRGRRPRLRHLRQPGLDLLAQRDAQRRVGRPRQPDGAAAPRWFLLYWADDTTAVGYAVSGPDGPRIRPGDRLDLMSCVVPSGACEILEDTAGETIRFPVGAVDATAVTLQDGSV